MLLVINIPDWYRPSSHPEVKSLLRSHSIPRKSNPPYHTYIHKTILVIASRKTSFPPPAYLIDEVHARSLYTNLKYPSNLAWFHSGRSNMNVTSMYICIFNYIQSYSIIYSVIFGLFGTYGHIRSFTYIVGHSYSIIFGKYWAIYSVIFGTYVHIYVYISHPYPVPNLDCSDRLSGQVLRYSGFKNKRKTTECPPNRLRIPPQVSHVR